MKKSLKCILCTLIFALFCPIVFFACGEVKFEDVPYTSCERGIEDVVDDFNKAKGDVINLGLKVKFETTNTYTFYNTSTTTAKDVKDVIVTAIGSKNDNPTIVSVNTTRFINNVKQTNSVNTYVNTPSSQPDKSYCYTYNASFTTEKEIIEKNRVEYNWGSQTLTDFYSHVVYDINAKEIASVQQKEFEGLMYYRLNSDDNTLDLINDKFLAVGDDSNNLVKLEDNPQLFKVQTKAHHDGVESFYYECAKNSNDYASYFTINYNVTNISREVYLSVSSVTKLIQYGEAVTLGEPNDTNEYVANNFIKTMRDDASYITYLTSQPDDDEDLTKTLWTIVKFGDNYSAKKEEYQKNALIDSKLYYITVTEGSPTIFEANDASGNKTLRDVTSTFTQSYKLELFAFDFSQSYYNKNANSYQFGEEENAIVVTFENNKVYSASTNNEGVTIYLEDYGNNYKLLSNFESFITPETVKNYTYIS